MPEPTVLPLFARCLAALLSLAGVCLAQSDADRAEAPPRRPNVVLILADDLGQGDLGCFNPDSKIPTPRLDALAAQGVRFTDAHSPSAVCTPTRYALLTGRFAWRSRMKTGVLDGRSRLLIEPDRETIASRLRDVGYDTAVFGKWHLGLGSFDPERPRLQVDYARPLDGGPHTTGFGQSLIIPASLDMAPYLWVRDGAVERQPTAETPGSQRRWDGGDGFWRRGGMAPDFDFYDVQPRIVRETVSWLRARRTDSAAKPFFCYVPLAAPHTPWMPNEEFRGLSGAGWYGDFVAEVDAGVGAILDTIDELGVAENTIVVVSSDNGSHWRPQDVENFGHAANAQWRGMKADAWEAGHRVPLIVRWPAQLAAPGSSCDALVGLVDLYATLTAAAGAPIGNDEAEDSVSMLGVWRGTDERSREELICHSMSGAFVLRQGRWKLIDRLGSWGFSAPRRPKPTESGPQGQLYDLANDPGESNNLWLEQPDRVATMLARIAELREAGRSVTR